MTTKSKTTEDATQAVHEAMSKMQKMGLNSMTWMGSDWAERMADLGSEMLNFMAERVQEDVDFQHRLLHCKDMTELHKLQAEFMQRMINRYTEETGKIMELSTKAWMGQFGIK